MVIKIEANFENGANNVKATGSITEVISDSNVGKFLLNDSQLKSYIEKYFGKYPNDAYLKSPTPWDDLYSTYNWPQVQTILRPIEAVVLDDSGTPTILAQKRIQNPSSVAVTYQTSITQEVSETIQHTWSNSNSVTVNKNLDYSFKGLGGNTDRTYSEEWGTSETITTTVTVGTTDQITLNLEPGQSVDVQLTATRAEVIIRVTFECVLTGVSAVNYNPQYNGHHFYSLPINNVMTAGGAPIKKIITQDIKIGFVTDTHIVIKDATTNPGRQIVELGDQPPVGEHNGMEVYDFVGSFVPMEVDCITRVCHLFSGLKDCANFSACNSCNNCMKKVMKSFKI